MNQQPPEETSGLGAEGNAPRPKHDAGLKRLFSHRRMVADLLRLLPDSLTGGINLRTLRRLPAEHVGAALRRRFSDMPWRIDFPPPSRRPSAGKGARPPVPEGSPREGAAPSAPASLRTPALEHPGTCLLLVEFQSSVDLRMAARMLEYAVLLHGDLVREGRVLGPGGGPPPLLPLVVYNGRRPWTAPVQLGRAGGLPVGLAGMQPQFRYELLEVRRFDRDRLALGLRKSAAGVNFALAYFALENASAPDLPAALAAVARLLKAEGELDLAESFGLWVEAVLEPCVGVRLPSLTEMMEEPPMLAETLDEWAKEKYRLGQAEGMKRGRSTGRVEGRVEGRMEGRMEGRVEGERELLRRQAERRFGADVAEALSKLIEGLDAPDRLAEVGDLVVDCATGSELLDRAART